LALTLGKTSFTPGTPLPDHWFHILLALADDKRHGLGIIQEVTAQTNGYIQVWPGMLYLALKRMTDEGLVAETEAPADFVTGGGRPRFYRITPLGRRACKAEADRHARLVNAARAKRILRKDP
jgi:DNA-binding PadR family transcriptional regulator